MKLSDFNTADFNEVCGLLESYIMRRMTVRATSKNYNNFFTFLISNEVYKPKDLHKVLRDANGSSNYFPSDDELKQAFESRIRTEHNATALLGFNGYCLEHLMPKNWRKNWPKLNDKKSEDERDSKLLTPGNLAIITQALDASIKRFFMGS